MRFLLLILLCGSVSPSIRAQTHEKFQNAEVIYDLVSDNHGDQLRTLITRPKVSTGRVPAIFFVGWLSCDSVEYPLGETDGFGTIFWRLVEQSGYATFRVDKPGSARARAIAPAQIFLLNCPGIRRHSIPFPNTTSSIPNAFSSLA
jgi:hypothetical protein